MAAYRPRWAAHAVLSLASLLLVVSTGTEPEVTTSATASAEDALVKAVTLFKNGYSTGGVALQLQRDLVIDKDGQALAEYLSQYITVEHIQSQSSAHDDATSTRDPAVPLADRVYNGRGQVLTGYADILPQDRLYLVAPGLLFVWPFVSLGHRVHVQPRQSPTGSTIVIESFSESPRVFHLHGFVSSAEADALIAHTLEIGDEDGRLQRSKTGPVGNQVLTTHRTSENAFDQVSDTAVAVRKRVFDVLAIGDYNSELCDGLQLLRYQQRQAYVPHTDFFNPRVGQRTGGTNAEWNWNPATGGANRFATVFMYLSNVTRGGQTVFTRAEMPTGLPDGYGHPKETRGMAYAAQARALFDPKSWEYRMAHQCATKLAVYPRKAHAILFYNQKPNGELDNESLHGGCPVFEGTKWAANLWVWNKRRRALLSTEAYQPAEAHVSFSVTFQNPSENAVDVYWADTKMHTLEPRAKVSFTTSKAHHWSLRDAATGRVLLSFTGKPEDGDDQVVLVPIESSNVDSGRDEL